MKIPNQKDLMNSTLVLLSIGMVISGGIILIGLDPLIVFMACMIIFIAALMMVSGRLIIVCIGGMLTSGVSWINPNSTAIITVLFLIILVIVSFTIVTAPPKSKMVKS